PGPEQEGHHPLPQTLRRPRDLPRTPRRSSRARRRHGSSMTVFLTHRGFNAVAESFFSSLKKERIKKQIYKNRELAIADVADYIDTFYNSTRRHSHLGGVSPEQFEAAHKPHRKGVH